VNDIILTCCGAAAPPPPKDLRCPECSTAFAESAVKAIQMNELFEVPVVNVYRAAKMLKESDVGL